MGAVTRWARLKCDAARAVTGRVAYVPGTAFFANGQGSDHMRLSFCFPTPDRIREGVRRLARVNDSESELLDIFGPSGMQARTSREDNPGPDLL